MCMRSRFLCPPCARSLVGFASAASLPLCCMAASPLNRVTSVSNSHVLKRFFHARAMADHEAGGAAGVAAPAAAEDSSAISILLDYHAATKHHLKRYAKGPHGLDWANKPNPFRRYEGAPVRSLLQLPESPPSVDDPLYSAVFCSSSSSSSSSSSLVSLLNKPLTIASLSQLLYDSLALSAWKSTGRKVRCLRVNPSSGNLHPTEAYIVCDAIDGISASPFVAHYAPKEHALEIRAELPIDVWHGLTQGLPPGSLLLGLTSIFWREAWKYGERAFRYCNHDVGHAIGAVAVGAASLGWNACLLDGYGTHQLNCLFGLTHELPSSMEQGPIKGVFPELECEHGDCIMAIFPFGDINLKPSQSHLAHLSDYMKSVQWKGKMNVLSTHHVKWPIIYQAAEASFKPATGFTPHAGSKRVTESLLPYVAYEPMTMRQVVRKRRSAQNMDSQYGMLLDVFYQMLLKTLPTGGAGVQAEPHQLPFGVLPWKAEVHLVLFSHRIVGLKQGIYILVRNFAHKEALQKAMRPEFVWEKPESCPSSLPLYKLYEGDCRDLATHLSCHQEIAGESCFSLGMVARFEPAIREQGAWMYSRLFWETGVIGQILYLEAHAFGISATGIGCYFDDAVHDVLGLEGTEFQSLYHFTVGVPLVDKRLLMLPAYPAPAMDA